MKKLYRKRDGKMLTGLCGGVAEYFNIDTAIVRLAWVVFSCLGGSGLLAYIIASIVVPNKPDES